MANNSGLWQQGAAFGAYHEPGNRFSSSLFMITDKLIH